MELTINGQVYQFNFWHGIHERNEQESKHAGRRSKRCQEDIGLRYAVAGIMDGDVEALEDLLLVANKGQNPRATTEILDEYIDDPDTDINQLFEDTMGFLKSANATKKCVQNLEKTIEEEKAKK